MPDGTRSITAAPSGVSTRLKPAATRSISRPTNAAPSLSPPGRSIRASTIRPSSTRAARASPIPAS
jgi:hypothetical protein